MPTFNVGFHRLALKEYDNARRWYADRSAGAAQRFKEAVDEATMRIAEAPESLPRMSGPYRWARVRRFRYILVFRPRRPGEMVVVAVAHTSRRPAYWRHRQIE
jgi:plasmid stabilization system protein ParE